MVLESLNILKLEEHPKKMLILGFIYSTLGLFVSLLIFGKYSSLAGIFITSIPLIIAMNRIFELEEGKDKLIHEERFLIKEHTKVLSFFIFTFIGMTSAYILWFTVLPSNTINNAFSSQIETIGYVTGKSIDATGYVSNASAQLRPILYNNLKVLIFCIVLSFVYGSGAVFVLTWNASVIGVAAGNTFRTILSKSANYTHSVFIYNYFKTFPIGFGYALHGIPEIAAYFSGALAGGIISVAVVNHDYKTKEFRHIVIDSIDLIILSIALLITAGIIEVYITPMIL